MTQEQDWAPSESLEWGPKRPPAVSWAGALLLVVAISQLATFALATLLDPGALLTARADRIVIGSVFALFALQLLAAVAVLRLWRWWRGITMFLCALGLVVQGANLAGPPDEPLVVGVNVGMAVLYLIVLLLLSRNREAFG